MQVFYKCYNRLPENYKQRYRQFKQTALDRFGHTDYTRFFLLGFPRTGSSYLALFLDSCKEIEMHHEIFRAAKRPYCPYGSDFESIFSTFTRKRWPHVKAVGCKVFYEHLTDNEWQTFIHHDEFKVIHLMRRNRLRVLVSLDIALANNQWNCSEGERLKRLEEKKCTLEPATILQRLERFEELEHIARTRFQKHDTIELYYEDLFSDLPALAGKLSRFLGVSNIRPHNVPMKRQNPESLQALIVNYEEIAAALQGTKFEGYLQ